MVKHKSVYNFVFGNFCPKLPIFLSFILICVNFVFLNDDVNTPDCARFFPLSAERGKNISARGLGSVVTSLGALTLDKIASISVFFAFIELI